MKDFKIKKNGTVVYYDKNRLKLLPYFILCIMIVLLIIPLRKNIAITTIEKEVKTEKPNTLLDTIVFSSNASVEKYLQRFKKVAVYEMDKFGIPASITLAQGLLESKIGESKSSRKYNNHFGIKKGKGWSGKTHKLKDDDYKNGKLVHSKFRVYNTAWESYRDHSKLLMRDRYKNLKKALDYREYANGLQKCGYATDKKYAKKLICIINKYELYRLDKKT